MIFNGHSSHFTPEFDQHCAENDIILICMPAHYPTYYNLSTDKKLRISLDLAATISTKEDFLWAFPQARLQTHKPDTIRKSFKVAGLIPYNAVQVLSQLQV